MSTKLNAHFESVFQIYVQDLYKIPHLSRYWLICEFKPSIS